MKHYIASACMLLLLTSGTLVAQEISLDGEYRINPVYSRGFRKPMYEGDKAGFFTMQRTRIMFTYKKEKDLEGEIVLQDRRFWGDQDDRADVANIAVFRAWVEKYFTPEFSIRLGRQGFVYDDQYLFGDPNWVGTRAHDAALLKYEKPTFKAHLALSYNANGQELKREAYEYNMYKNLQFIWLEKTINKLTMSFVAVNRGMEKGDTTSAYMQTFGPYVDFDLSDKVKLRGLYYYQVGHDTQDREVSASFFSAQLHYKQNDNLTFILGADAGSGTDQRDLNDPANTKSHTFDRHYGLLHGQFGYIDYFYVNEATEVGVHDYYLKTKVNITKKLSLEDHIHEFATSGTLSDPLNDNKPMKRNLGLENDFLINYKFSSMFKAQLGYSIFFGTRTLDQFFGGQKSKENQVLYAVITATPNFFKTKLDNK